MWNCNEAPVTKGALSSYLPEGTSVVFKIKDWQSLQNDLRNSDLLSEYSKTNAFTFFSEDAPLLSQIAPSQESILCVSKNTDSTSAYTFITRQTPDLFESDSIPNTSVETFTYGDFSLKKVTIQNNDAYVAVKDSMFIASSSQALLQSILEGKIEKDPTFLKLYNMNDPSNLTALISLPKKRRINSATPSFASHTNLHIEVLSNGITATGVALARDTIPQILSIFKGQQPQKNDLATLLPATARKGISLTYSDAEKLQQELKIVRGDSLNKPANGLLESINEVGYIELDNGTALALKSIDPDLTNQSVARYISEADSFREIKLYTFNEPNLLANAFSPVLPSVTTNYMFALESFFIFTETQTEAEAIISAFINGNTMAKTGYFETSAAQLSTSSSLLYYNLKGSEASLLTDYFSEETAAQLVKIAADDYPLTALQFTYDRDFAHVNYSATHGTTSDKQTIGTVSEQFNSTLKNEILGLPSLFSNHRTKGNDVVVQDVTNTLYLYSDTGNVLWSKKLDAPILGTVQEVDLLRNGKKQLAFATKNNFYVLDRNGNPVAPFPIKFKDDITQPLSVFDYDTNRKYRFIITQGNEVFMYDKDGKIVKGFTYKKAASNIVLPPVHIRMNNKDYIVIAEENGKLTILSRTGKLRVPVKNTFQFSETPVLAEEGNFIVITKGLTKETISQTGTINSQPLNVTANYGFSILGNTKATLDDNLLRINGKLAELPFGIYTKPMVFNANRTTYVTVTETQENKVYVFDKNGTLVSGFPIYGTSQAYSKDAAQRGSLDIVVKGEDKELILYRYR
ncbi:hypothetical protein ULVI_02655 [Cochleicola gelatinilyticus]|uniref:Uncharacterized protein n=1 Tax=Cochleicola gelatinilyticus TaxID=1763537 RepID=A0A167IHV6_9FLAO|nr:hypothetical protein ULVI_02655 [Cochleicola gelatinilyticus]